MLLFSTNASITEALKFSFKCPAFSVQCSHRGLVKKSFSFVEGKNELLRAYDITMIFLKAQSCFDPLLMNSDILTFSLSVL